MENQNVAQLDSLSLIELKALHYDALKEYARCQNNLQILTKKIEDVSGSDNQSVEPSGD